MQRKLREVENPGVNASNEMFGFASLEDSDSCPDLAERSRVGTGPLVGFLARQQLLTGSSEYPEATGLSGSLCGGHPKFCDRIAAFEPFDHIQDEIVPILEAGFRMGSPFSG